MRTTAQYLDLINDAIDHIDFPANLPGLYDPIKYAVEAGGKRLRPMLLLAMNDAFGGNVDDCLWPAVGIEIFHNFTLVHDDVMDHAEVRRGRPCVHRRWDVNTAILSGDAMVTMAYKCAAGCPPSFLPEVIDRFSMMTMNVYEGQQRDVEMEHAANVTFGEYLRMIMGKTSALIAYPCAIGALIAGASQTDIEEAFNYGVSLGIAFQMQDDYLDVYGDETTFGKAIGGDILNDKKTWLWIIANNEAPDAYAKAIADSHSPAEKIANVTAVFDSLGLRQKGAMLIDQYTADAITCLEASTMPHDAAAWFRELALKLVNRDK